MARKMRVVLFLGAILYGWIGMGLLYAQQRPVSFEFRHVQEEDGLSFNFISCFLYDRDGFLWIGTFDGLNRYDGNHFTTFKYLRTNQNGLLNNAVHDLCEDHDGNIWMALEGGIGWYGKKTRQFRYISSMNGRGLGSCNNILCDRNGDIWFTSDRQGLFRYLIAPGTIQAFPYDPVHDPLGTTTRIVKNGLLLDPHQNGLWIADGSGLRYFDIGSGQFTDSRHNPRALPIFNQHHTSALTLDGTERLIFSDNIDHRIVVYNLRTQQIERTVTPVSRAKRDVFDIATIFVDRQHNLWTSSWNHVVFYIEARTYQCTELTHTNAKNTSIAADFFWAGWQHPDGTIWLGTVNGISYTNPERAFYDVYDLGILFPELIDERGIISFLEDSDGSWWLGTSIRGLLHYSPQTNQLDVYRLPDGTPKYPYGLPITGLQAYGDALYIGTQNALFVFDKSRKKFSGVPLPSVIRGKNSYLRNFRLQHDSLWVFGESKQTFCYQLTQKQWTSYPILSRSRDPRFMVRFSLIDQKGNLWLELYPEGLARFSKQNGQFTLVDVPQSAPYEHTITSFAEDKRGSFWMASAGYGLIRYDPYKKQISRWTENEGLAYDYCESVLADRSGTIWMGAHNKFSVFSTTKNRFLNFTLPINQSNIEYQNYLFSLRNGHILSAQKGYLVELKPEKINRPPTKETVLISSMILPDTTYLLPGSGDGVQLAATDNTFSIQFSVLAQLQETPYRYLYKLEGYDNNWLEAITPGSISYGKLPGGNYAFQVKAVDINGVETPVSTLAVHIDTLFYKSIWFWALIALLVLGLLYRSIRSKAYQTAKLHHLNLQATRLERDKAEIHYQNLINHLNPHFLFNSLTSLNSLILTKPKAASLFLRKLSAIYRYILQNKDKEVISLADELAFAQNYVELQKSRFDEGLQVSFSIDNQMLERQIVPVTIQNLIENAIKHNTIEDENPLIIQVYTEAESLIVMNTLQRKLFVETSNKQGLASLKSLYHYLSKREVEVKETATHFTVIVPLF
jgi:ligand-binding sensor domain-containing protein